eukprot:1345831-Rhodomonas_salina.2
MSALPYSVHARGPNMSCAEHGAVFPDASLPKQTHATVKKTHVAVRKQPDNFRKRPDNLVQPQVEPLDTEVEHLQILALTQVSQPRAVRNLEISRVF